MYIKDYMYIFHTKLNGKDDRIWDIDNISGKILNIDNDFVGIYGVKNNILDYYMISLDDIKNKEMIMNQDKWIFDNDVSEIKKDENTTLSVKVTVKPEVKLGKYKGIKVEKVEYKLNWLSYVLIVSLIYSIYFLLSR